MKKKIIIPLVICILALGAITAVIVLQKNDVDYTMASRNTTASKMEADIGSKPDKTTNKNGSTISTYNNSTYMDYEGKMNYYYLEDKLVMSRWETECNDEANMEKVYKNICANINKDMGNGKENKEQQCASWTSSKKDLTVGCNVSTDKKYTVYVVENLKQTSEKQKKK